MRGSRGKGRGKDLRGLEGVRYCSKRSFLIPPNWGHLEGEGMGVVPLILKRFKWSSLPL